MAAAKKTEEISEMGMSDQDLETALDALSTNAEDGDVNELLKMMNDNRIISWDEVQQIRMGSTEVVKSGLPEHQRPSEPENETDVEECYKRLIQNDPGLKEINLNNMKRTPIPQIQRLIAAIRDNSFLKKLSLANTALSDTGAEPLVDVIENNKTLKSLNLETNFMSGEFLGRLFKAALKNQTLEEVKCVNQSMNFHTQAERDIIEAINANVGLVKVSINLRLPEGRYKIENALIRNGEYRRILRKKKADEMKKKGGAQPKFEGKTET